MVRPPSQALQAQFLLDLQTACNRACPTTWEWASSTGIPPASTYPDWAVGLFNGGTNLPDAIYVWNGLTIFDNADTSGTTNVNDPNYSTPLPALDSLGGH